MIIRIVASLDRPNILATDPDNEAPTQIYKTPANEREHNHQPFIIVVSMGRIARSDQSTIIDGYVALRAWGAGYNTPGALVGHPG